MFLGINFKCREIVNLSSRSSGLNFGYSGIMFHDHALTGETLVTAKEFLWRKLRERGGNLETKFIEESGNNGIKINGLPCLAQDFA